MSTVTAATIERAKRVEQQLHDQIGAALKGGAYRVARRLQKKYRSSFDTMLALASNALPDASIEEIVALAQTVKTPGTPLYAVANAIVETNGAYAEAHHRSLRGEAPLPGDDFAIANAQSLAVAAEQEAEARGITKERDGLTTMYQHSVMRRVAELKRMGAEPGEIQLFVWMAEAAHALGKTTLEFPNKADGEPDFTGLNDDLIAAGRPDLVMVLTPDEVAGHA